MISLLIVTIITWRRFSIRKDKRDMPPKGKEKIVLWMVDNLRVPSSIYIQRNNCVSCQQTKFITPETPGNWRAEVRNLFEERSVKVPKLESENIFMDESLRRRRMIYNRLYFTFRSIVGVRSICISRMQ